MNYFEFQYPYYALIKAKSKENAVEKYIEVIARDESDIDMLLMEAKIIPVYYAAAKLSRAKDENGNLVDFDEVISTFERDDTEILVIDGSLV